MAHFFFLLFFPILNAGFTEYTGAKQKTPNTWQYWW